jgi:tetratricopeptide (TPR) repeat protein/TolB-like protein
MAPTLRRTSPLPRTLLVGLLGLSAARAAAQCPDGAPPPCRGASAATRMHPVNPQLSQHTWIVVPFTNATRTADLDWLRDASVNLLTLDLGQWSDIRVVDDKHVGDLLRELPPARVAQPLTLNDGVAIARRAGAGRLVMGDYFRIGKGARFIVNVFDVVTGKRLRSVTHDSADPDSVLGAFAPIARGVLALPPPPDAKLGATGTTRVDAYQEYLMGTTALNRFAVDTAVVHLRRALALDSGFALAHYKLAVAMHWTVDRSSADAESAHALAASRLSGGLPARERALINARLAIASGENERACEGARTLVARDSLDVEAIYTVGECEYHGGRQIGEPIDSLHGRFRGNWNRAIASFRRVLALDPTYHPAFGHVVDMLSPPVVVVCPANPTPGVSCGNDPAVWIAVIIREGDSLDIRPVRSTGPDYGAQFRRATANRSRVLNLQAARRIAEDWVEASQHGARSLLDLGRLNIQLGELAAADDALRQIGKDADRQTRVEGLEWRLQIAAQRADGPGGLKLLDSLGRLMVTTTDSEMYASHAIVYGKLQPIHDVIRRLGAASRWPPERVQYTLDVPRILLGVPDERFLQDERAFWLVAPGDSVCAAGLPTCRTSFLLPSLAYASNVRRTWWPPFSVETWGYRFEIARGLSMNDRAAVVKSMEWMDSSSHADNRVLAEESSLTALALGGALAIGDSSRALRYARFATDTLLPYLYDSGVGGTPGGAVYYKPAMAPRLMLLRAELEAALGSRDEARIWYDRVLSLWSDADAELQPVVARIRAARAALGPPRD